MHQMNDTRDRARKTIQTKAETAKEKAGRKAFEVVEDRFPEQAKRRRRRQVIPVLLAGIAVGVLLRHVLER